MEKTTKMEVATMGSVRVKKADLLEKLRTNRDKHNVILEKATRQYWTALQSKLEKMVDRVKQHRDIDNYVGLKKPIDNSKDYDLAISMLEYSIDAVIELTPQEFSKFFLNEWSWRSDFTNSVRGISGSGSPGVQGHQGYAGPQGAQGAQGPQGSWGIPSEEEDLEALLEDF